MSKDDEERQPAQVDPNALIRRQREEQNIAQITPLGTQRFGTIGEGGGFSPEGGRATQTTLTPAGQTQFDLEQQIMRLLGGETVRAAGQLPQDPLSFEGLPGVASELDRSGLTPLPGIDDFSADALRVEDTTFNRLKGLLDPEFELRERRLRQRLADQGLPVESEAASGETGELTRFGRARSEADLAAALEAVGAGRAEQSRLFGLASAARGQGEGELRTDADLGFRARGQDVSEAQLLRNQPFQELLALLSGTQPTQIPNFQLPAPVDTLTPQALALQQSNLGFEESGLNYRANLAGLYGLGQAALGAGGSVGRGFASRP